MQFLQRVRRSGKMFR